MQPYQEEYITNLKEIILLNTHKKTAPCSFETYQTQLSQNRQQIKKKVARNMELLRDGLFPLLDNLLEATPEELTELEEFTKSLLNGKNELDGGLFCHIHQALLSRARLEKNPDTIIQHLYWLGIGRNNLCSKMVGLDLSQTENYMSQMRLCFAEAAAYLKYYDELEDSNTRGYILRSRANTALGQFKSASSKIHITRQTLQILQDKDYQTKEPDLPWDRYIYLTHQQMISGISYSRSNDMTAQDVADIMESAHIVYQRRIQEAIDRKEKPPVKPAFSCYTIEYYCGLSTLEELLGKMEVLLDAADPTDFSLEGMYAVISLPAFYCQYLREYPEHLPGRETYLEQLYQRVLDYVDAFPESEANEQIFFYFRQLSTTFIETPHSISYGEFQQKLMMRFAPDIYVHAQVVGTACVALCSIIIDEEPTFFDDIEHIQIIQDPDQKRQTILTYARDCGVLHDMGKINFLSLYSKTPRQWFEDEYEMAHLHTIVGESRLQDYSSTRHCAAIALGHHSWYDGSRGYPKSFKRLQCPYRQMIDVVSLLDWIDAMMNTSWLYGVAEKTFDEAVATAISLEGKQFSPLLTARLRDKTIAEKLKQVFITAHEQAYYQLYKATITP